MTNVSQYIENQGGIMSGALAEYIIKNEDITPDAARKKIQRLKTPIHKLKGIFADKQSFVYHANNYKSEKYFESLEDAIFVSAKRCAAFIAAINYHHGIISKTDLPNYVYAPIVNIKGHVKYSTLRDKLIDLQILFEYDSDHYCLNGFMGEYKELNFRHCKAIQFSKELILNQFSNWSRNIGLYSYNKGLLNKEIGGFQFSFAAPSYLNGLVQYKNSEPKPGFVVADVLIGNSTGLDQVNFFIQKIQAIRASNPTLRLFPVLIIDGVDVKALNKLKTIGVVIGSIKEIFGESYLELLKSLINIITNAGVILKKDPESYINLMTQLTKLVEGKTNNLRGDLFELAVGYYYGKQCQSLDVGKRIRIENNFKTRDIDVLAIYESEIKIIECKGYNYPVDEVYVKEYLSQKIPDIRKWLEVTYPNKKQTFEIWSTGGFTEESTELLETAKTNTKRYSINFLDKESILEKAKELQTSKFTDILKNYFFKELG